MKLIDSIRKRHKFAPNESIGFAVSSVESLRMKEFSDDGPPPVFSGLATTATVDSDDEVVVPKGLDWTYALSFKAMYPSHTDYGIGPIAKLNNAKLSDDGWLYTAVWLKSNPMAKDFYNIARELGVMGVSIGFRTLEAGRPTQDEVKAYGPHKTTIRRADVVELSPTFMPANPDTIVAIKSGAPALDGEQAKAVHRLAKMGRVSKDTYQLLTRGTRVIVVV